MRAVAPGKIILSGEHSVVYGAPALALAVDHHIQADFVEHSDTTVIVGMDDQQHQLALSELPELLERLDRNFSAFEKGELSIDQVLTSPADLLFYVMAQCRLTIGGRLTTASTLESGAGMGSSAAAIASTLLAVQQSAAGMFSVQDRFQMVRFCERLQHGKGSAIDAAAVCFGGLIRVQQSNIQHLELSIGSGWYRIHTGTPSVTTGQCVAEVRRSFSESAIWSEFSDVTEQIQQCLAKPAQLIKQLRENHRLLCAIGVVPVPVQNMIAEIENAGGAAKVSGAGAHQGEYGGQVIAYLPHLELTDLQSLLSYPVVPLLEDSQGARVVQN